MCVCVHTYITIDIGTLYLRPFAPVGYERMARNYTTSRTNKRSRITKSFTSPQILKFPSYSSFSLTQSRVD